MIKKELSFSLIQNITNIDLLIKIQKTLNMGNVIKQGSRVCRFIVNCRRDIRLLILLFNGHFLFPSRKIQFHLFLTVFNQRNLDPIIYIPTHLQPTLDNPWLIGLTETQGSFTYTTFRTRFVLTQKGDINLPILSNIMILLKTGHIEGNSKKDNYLYVVSGLTNVYKIYSYFDFHIDSFERKHSYLEFKEFNAQLVSYIEK